MYPRGVLGNKHDGGGTYVVHPKKYKTGNYSNHAFGYCGNFGLNCVRTISLAEIRTQKNTRRFFTPKKIHG